MQAIGSFFTFLNNALLKMTWLNTVVNWFLSDVIGLDEESVFYGSIDFFIYDVIKIFILLSVLIYISSYIQSYFSPERTKQILSRFNGISGNVIGALLGTVTPFCSCSSIPIFIGFTQAGLPISVTFSFLISSPLVDLASVLLLAGIFGWSVALGYVILGLLIAIIGGTIIGKLGLEDQVASFITEGKQAASVQIDNDMTKRDRHDYAYAQVVSILRKVWKYVLIGVGIGAIIHGYIPQTIIETVLGEKNPFSVILATLVGVPMYADIFGTLPIAEALVYKGVQLGTVLSFMMAVTALSLPSIILLKQVVKPKLLWIFVTIVVIGIIITGYLFNAVDYLFI